MRTLHSIAKCSLMVAISGGLLFGQQTISDGTFNNADWTVNAVSTFNAFNPTFSGSQISGGNPGTYRVETHTAASGNGPGVLRGFHRYGPQTLNLASGISTISYSYDLVNIGPSFLPNVEYRIALQQGSTTYVGPNIDTILFGTAFTTFTGSGLTESNFCAVNPSAVALDCTSHPNFTVGAASISVGYQVANTIAVGQNINATSGLDNFSITASAGFPALTCSASATPRNVRSLGSTELVDDVVVICRGGVPTATGQAIPQVDFSISSLVPITTPIIGLPVGPGFGGIRSGALLLLDEPAPANQFVCDSSTGSCGGFGNGTGATTYYGSGTQSANSPNNRNVHAGWITSSANAVIFQAIPFDPPGSGIRTLRFTNVRLDANSLSVGTAVLATINNSAQLTISGSPVAVAVVSTTLTSSLRDAANSANQTVATAFPLGSANSFQKIATLRFSEGFQMAFMGRSLTAPPNVNTSPTPVSQNTPGTAYTSETGFYNSAFPNVPNIGDFRLAGLASQGTRLVVKFKNLPPQTQIYVDTLSTGASATEAARLTATQEGVFSAVNPPTSASTGIVQLTVASDGTATAIWEVLNANPLTSTNFDFGLYYSSAAVPVGTYPTPQVDFSIVPANPDPSLELPLLTNVPRFNANSSLRNLFQFTIAPVSPPVPIGPNLIVSPNQVSFSSTQGQPSPAAQTLSVTSSGASLDFSVSSGGALPITFTPSRGTTPGSVSVSVNTTGLAPGTYKDTVTITAGGAQNPSVPVGISVIVKSTPLIISLDPANTVAGGPAFPLTVTGRGFLSGAVVNFGTIALRPISSNESQLVVTVTPDLITQVGSVPVTVTNPDGGLSNAVDFFIGRLTITLLSPVVRTATAVGFALTVSGVGFQQGATVEFGSTSLTPISATNGSLTANVPASAITQPGTIQVSVKNPNLQVSNQLPFTVRPVPVIESATPNPVALGTAVVTVVVTGRNFFDGVTIQANNLSLATTFISPTQLTVVLPVSLLGQLATTSLTALTPDGVRSSPYLLQIGIITVNIPTVTVGDGNTTIVITGTGFGQGTLVQFSCQPPPPPPVTLAISIISSTSLTAVLPGNLLTRPGVCQLTVSTPSGSGTAQITVNTSPQISGLSQNTIQVGSPTFSLIANGIGFEAGSVIRWNSTALTTTPVTGGLKADVPASLLTTPGGVTISVVGPRGAPSNGLPFTVFLPPVSLLLVLPTTTSPGKDETVTVSLGGPFPADLVGSLTLTFRPDAGLPDDPAIQFSNNSRTLPINIPAQGQTKLTATFKTGTSAGVITLTPQLTSGPVAVTGTGLTPQTLTVPRAVAGIATLTCTRKAGAFDVVATGFTNTRQASQALFSFTGNNLGTSSLTVDATAPFTTWAATKTCTATAGISCVAFEYTQPFTVQGNVTDITTVKLQLTNQIGQSVERSASCQ